MNQLPEYKFELFSDRLMLSRFTSAWLQAGAGQAWVFGSGRWTCAGAQLNSQNLYRDLVVPTSGKVRVVIGVRAVKAATITISFWNPTTATTQRQEIHSAYLVAGPQLQLLNFTVNVYANVRQFINIFISSTVADLSCSVEQIQVFAVNGLTRIIKPGNFKSIGVATNRNRYFGSDIALTGSITLVGEDWRWLSAILFDYPSRQIRMRLTVTSGVTVLTSQLVLLDTVAYQGIAKSISYQATFNILQQSGWQQLVSYINERIDLSVGQDVNSQQVIDGYRNDLSGAIPNIGKVIVMQQKFLGYARAGSVTSPITMPADSIQYIGFGNEIQINDGFVAPAGNNNDSSLATEGIFSQIIGTIQLTYTRSNASIVFEYMNTNAGTWVTMNSGVLYNISIPAAAWDSNRYLVRVRNTANNQTHNFYISGAITASFLNVVTRVKYPLAFVGYRPVKALKSYIARIVGEYDNFSAPIFESGYVVNSGGGLNTASQFILNPPPFTIKAVNKGVTGSLMPSGQYYTGGDRWNVSGANIQIVGGVQPNSNMWVLRGQNLVSGSDYISKGNQYQTSINVVSRAAVAVIRIYGTYGLQRDLLASNFLQSTGLLTNTFTANKYYDGFGFEIEGAAYSMTVSSFLFAQTGAAPPLGANAKVLIANGTGIIRTSDLTTGPPATLTLYENLPLACTFEDLLNSLLNIYGLTIYPEYDLASENTKIIIDSLQSVFQPTQSSVVIKADEWVVEPEEEFVYDLINVGGQTDDKFEFFGDASCTQSNYTSDYISSRRTKNMQFEASLNTPQFISLGLGNEDIAIVDLENILFNNAPRYRLDEQLTITGTPSALQPNWLFSEGRLVRNNAIALFAGGTQAYRLMFGKWSNLASVDFSGDTLGAVTDSDPILGGSAVRARKVSFSTAMTLQEALTVLSDRFKQFLVTTASGDYINYIKNFEYNFASGTAVIQVWLRSQIDNLFVNPIFINTLDPWLQTIASIWTWQNVITSGQGLARSGNNANSVLFQTGVQANIEQGFLLQFKAFPVAAQQIANTVPVADPTGWKTVDQFPNPFFYGSLAGWAQANAGQAWTLLEEGNAQVIDNAGTGSQILHQSPDNSNVSRVRFQSFVTMKGQDWVQPIATWTSAGTSGGFPPWTFGGGVWTSSAAYVPTASRNLPPLTFNPANIVGQSGKRLLVTLRVTFTASEVIRNLSVNIPGITSTQILLEQFVNAGTYTYTDVVVNISTNASFASAINVLIQATTGQVITFEILNIDSDIDSTSGNSTIETYQFVAGIWSVVASLPVAYVTGTQTIPEQVININPSATRVGVRFIGNVLNEINRMNLVYFLSTEAWFWTKDRGMGIASQLGALSRQLQITAPPAITLTSGVTKIVITYFGFTGANGTLNINGFPSIVIQEGSYTLELVANVSGVTNINFTVIGMTGGTIDIREARILAAPVDIIIVGKNGLVITDLYTIRKEIQSTDIESVNVDMLNPVAYPELGIRVNNNGSAGYAEIYYFQKKSL